MRSFSLAIAALAMAFGVWIVREDSGNPLVERVDRNFQDWVLVMSHLSMRPPLPVTLVEMEDPENWTALDYSLFLKALPKENPPVVVLESLPAESKTGAKSAFDRAFDSLAMRQPRLVLPVRLSTKSSKTEDSSANWWLDRWKAETPPAGMTRFSSVEIAPPEMLRGTVAAGVVNLPVQENGRPAVALVELLGNEYVPSVVLRAVMLVWKVPSEEVKIEDQVRLSGRRLVGNMTGLLPVDTSLLLGMRRFASSDLLLRLNQDIGGKNNETGVSAELLQGVVVLGDLSENARIFSTESGEKISRAEMIAAGIATICNGPAFLPIGKNIACGIVALAVLLSVLLMQMRWGWLGLTLPLIAYGYCFAAIWLVRERALALPLFLPSAVFLLSLLGQGLVRSFPKPKNESTGIDPTTE